MPRRAFNLATLIASNFEDASRYELDKAFELKHGRPPGDNVDDFALRAQMIAAFGESASTLAPPESALPTLGGASSITSALGRIPNLRPTGKWEGKMRRVTIQRMDEKSGSTALKIGWEGLFWTIAYDQTVDMPWPYWQSLKNTDLLDDCSMAVTEWVKTDETGYLTKVTKPRYIKTQRWRDHGDTPGTEDLPVDYTDFFRREALGNNCFEKTSRAALIRIHNILIEPVRNEIFNAEHFRDMKDIDIRIKISERLGPDVESKLMDATYAEAG